jgi:uncharacterized protein YjbJ (UPF0337 family)
MPPAPFAKCLATNYPPGSSPPEPSLSSGIRAVRAPVAPLYFIPASRRQAVPTSARDGYQHRREPMNWDRIEGNWKQFTGKLKEQWGKLTDDELTQINGNREQLEGKIQAHYGYGKDQARSEVDNWLRRQ